MLVVVIFFVVNFTEALQQIHVDYNANNVTVRGKYSCL